MTRPLSVFRLLVASLIVFALTSTAAAQSSSDDDAALDLAEPDFTVVNLPTTLRLPLHKGDFHLTHRFNGNLRCQTDGCLGDLAGGLFGLDNGAAISFEFRFAPIRHLQVGASRASFDRTVEIFGKYDAIHQDDSMPVSISGLVSVEGPNNFRERFAPALGVIVSRTIAERVAVYATPIWVHNSAAALAIDRDTLLIGVGGRVRLGPSFYVVGEVSPRAAGYDPGSNEYAFGFEGRIGAHVFQLNFANTQGTTYGQLARGGSPHTLYMGFNLTRKFF